MTEQTFNLAMGAWLKRQREQAHISRCALAKAVGVHRNTIKRWELGDPLTTWNYRQLQRTFAQAAGGGCA